MTIHTISGPIEQTVVLGNGTYADTLTITAKGGILPSPLVPTEVYDGLTADVDVANAMVVNRGSISGSIGYSAGIGTDTAAGSDGGIGVNLTTPIATVANFNVIAGGNGGAGYGGNAGDGGLGIVLSSVTSGALNNQGGKITGGNGGNVTTVNDAPAQAGTGASGAMLSGASLTNSGVIQGGDGGSGTNSSYAFAGSGGAGVDLSSSSTASTNGESIQGGNGGTGGVNENGGGGGIGLDLAAASLTNSDYITGGAGGAGGAFFSSYTDTGGSGGQGARLNTGATLINSDGYITGGAGGGGSDHGGTGGFGVEVTSGAVLENAYSITGGNGGLAAYFAGAGGAGVYLHASGTLENSAGSIVGGNGANTAAPGYAPNDLVTGGSGGAGVQMAGGATLDILGGTIDGGVGGYGVYARYLSVAGGSGGAGVTLATGATLQSGISITGGAGGAVSAAGLASGKANFGGIGGAGILLNGGSVSSAGTITGGAGGADHNYQNSGQPAGGGGDGVDISGSGTFINTGTIVGGAGGIDLGVSTVNNYYAGVLGGTGGAGVYVNGGTLTTSGTIKGGAGGADTAKGGGGSGGVGDAVRFGSVASTLVLDPGAQFDGQVVGQNNDDLALGGTAPSTLNGFGTQFTGFGALQFQAGSQWTVDTTESEFVSNAPSITGFAAGDAIDITDVQLIPGLTDSFADGVLAIKSGGFTFIDIDFDNPNGTNFVLTPDASGMGFDITLSTACYHRGTRIATETGEVPIEALRIGDRVATLGGLSLPIRWIGRRTYAPSFTAVNPDVLPVLIRAGALGDGLPRRDLWVSPEHAMYIDGMLIAARDLINGESIVQEQDCVGGVAYFHLEFGEHVILYAEGAPAESFVDDESRDMFDNAAEYHRLYPRPFHCAARYCAPRVEEGYLLQSVQRRCGESYPQEHSSLRTMRKDKSPNYRDVSALRELHLAAKSNPDH